MSRSIIYFLAVVVGLCVALWLLVGAFVLEVGGIVRARAARGFIGLLAGIYEGWQPAYINCWSLVFPQPFYWFQRGGPLGGPALPPSRGLSS